ncbi:MAG: riboflavin biosynthesis protein RibF [Atopobiaceae bacterium]|jgi:riboflavin kinase/FMN adenylyltransferase|nr:riboflavin biosynthesis protein RibF [Atopobiaceae bacterium]MCI2173282.1 riboflavin biosynthesis protein RibF [Atopobiaceae bacterium]MCI2207277.1 riboflavin biosynthesis protein RibF [Atopobiaceae bacterium]
MNASELVRESTLCDVRPLPEVGVGHGAHVVDVSSRWHAGDPCVCAIGAFDGVHVGHRALLADAASDAHGRGLPLVAVTFDPDPSDVLSGECVSQRLLTCRDRRRFLSTTPVDAILVLTFDSIIAGTEYGAFLDDVLLPLASPAAIHVGQGFVLGAGARGDAVAMGEYGHGHGFGLVAHPLVERGGRAVSATRTRSLLSEGDVRSAASLLGRPHYVSGVVVHGRGQGTGFGFPTANVSCDPSLRLPGEGVYAGYVRVGSLAWPAAVNVGSSRTFEDRREGFLEATLLGFDGDLYGEMVDVVFTDRLRPPMVFGSVEELERVVLGNVSWVRDNLGDEGVEVPT